jgi:hypothetical protein
MVSIGVHVTAQVFIDIILQFPSLLVGARVLSGRDSAKLINSVPLSNREIVAHICGLAYMKSVIIPMSQGVCVRGGGGYSR